MAEQESTPQVDKNRFYTRLTLLLAAWVGLALLARAALSVDGPAAFVIVMGGMLGILGGAMRHPTYLRLRGWVRSD